MVYDKLKDRLNELIDMQEYYLEHCDYEMSTREEKDLVSEFTDMCSTLKELQSLRKIDIDYTLKYAEEAGAACEELKYGIEHAVDDVKKLDRQNVRIGDFLDIFDKYFPELKEGK